LNQYWFVSLEEAREVIEGWREDYNHQRPHGSLEQLTRAEFARRCIENEEAKIQPIQRIVLSTAYEAKDRRFKPSLTFQIR
jgi:hypothetical protein